jgi:hypothetical protein
MTKNPAQLNPRFDRGSWIVLLLALGYIASAIIVVSSVYRQPSDGWWYDVNDDHGVRTALAPLVDDPGPLQPGDRLLAVEGIPLPESMLRPTPPPANWRVGATAHYTIQRAGQTMELDVPLTALSFSAYLRYYRLSGNIWLTNVLWYLIGFGVFFIRPRETAARLLLLFTTYLNTINTIILAGDSTTFFLFPPALFFSALLLNYLWVFMFAMMIHFALSFPLQKWPLTRHPRLALALLYGSAVLSLALMLITGRPEFYDAGLSLLVTILVISLFATTAHNLWRVHDPVVRAQISWVALGISSPIIVMLIPNILVSYISPALDTSTFSNWFFNLVSLLLPISFGIAITRYRLFDIHLIIRRTLQYSMLTGVLGLVYFGNIVLLQRLFRSLTGNVDSPLIVVISTLIIAALFNPLRLHIQDFIDRRFYRQKYDAEQALVSFAASMRQEVDLDEISRSLLAIAVESMQPETVKLWLKPTHLSPSPQYGRIVENLVKENVAR